MIDHRQHANQIGPHEPASRELDAHQAADEVAQVESRVGGCETQQRLPSDSVSNAAKQAHTAATILPDEIERRRHELESNLIDENRPQTTTTTFLWGEVARNFALIEFHHKSEIAALNVGARNAHRIAESTNSAANGAEVTTDDIHVAAFSNEFFERASRYRRQRESALYRSLMLLQAITSKSERVAPKLTIEDFRRQFPDSETCEKYLRSRREKSEWPCPRCDVRSRKHWISTRHCWECSRCGGQFGLRHASVMMDSPLSLEKWFLAIGTVCIDHDTTAAQIAEALGIARLATARRMLAGILTALRSSNRDELLVGLPSYIELEAALPERSGAFTPISQNEKSRNVQRPLAASENDTSS